MNGICTIAEYHHNMNIQKVTKSKPSLLGNILLQTSSSNSTNIPRDAVQREKMNAVQDKKEKKIQNIFFLNKYIFLFIIKINNMYRVYKKFYIYIT